MKLLTEKLEGAALDWAVASIEHPKGSYLNEVQIYRGNSNAWWSRIPDKKSRRYVLANYSTDWNQAGPIIDREDITVYKMPGGVGGKYRAEKPQSLQPGVRGSWYAAGSTYLEAAMRCYVASKLGNEVEVPDELIGGGI